ncbi:uncharacterized protein I303_103323 [Kwoniella dejecticola CBS 10117]|uniref:Uncharacterized protein n=1 Tax=Kwoniella dejecticola CBS 10117 TaxID=1296121 RepID=A0A1A6A6F6_9TREE|nr:uncharacterized protein I303_03346 [Kwoniella dejecticola CBS 10117]OBR85635.1 hypothetical protein I303_03346 [Kwoniella dejecticola CBS 10117]
MIPSIHTAAISLLLLSSPALAGLISIWNYDGNYICGYEGDVLEYCPENGGQVMEGDSPSCDAFLSSGDATSENLFYNNFPDSFNAPCPCGGPEGTDGLLDFYNTGNGYEVYWSGGDGTSLGHCNGNDGSKLCAITGTYSYAREYSCQLSACC